MPVDVASYLLGVASVLAVFAAYIVARRAQQHLRARSRARRRRRDVIARQARLEQAKTRVRFVPTDDR